MKRTVTEPATAARLLLAAGALDLLVVLLMIKMVLPFLAGRLPLLPPEVAPLFISVVVLLAYWLVTDVVCGGWSVGRACLMIEPRHKDGTRPGMFRRLWRLLRKTLTLGLAGLRMDLLSGYDQASGYQWLSTFGTGAALRTIDGEIEIFALLRIQCVAKILLQ